METPRSTVASLRQSSKTPICPDYRPCGWRAIFRASIQPPTEYNKKGPKYCIFIPSMEEKTAQDCTASDYLLEYLISKPHHSVKHIKLSLVLPSLVEGTSDAAVDYDWAIDLSRILNLGSRFKTVVIRLVCPTVGFKDAFETLQQHAVLMPLMQRETARIARYLVEQKDGERSGGKANGCVLHQYWEPVLEKNHALDRLELVNNAFECHIEASSSCSRHSGSIQPERLRYFAKFHFRNSSDARLDYFVSCDAADSGELSWVCRQTGEVMSLPSPSQGAIAKF